MTYVVNVDYYIGPNSDQENYINADRGYIADASDVEFDIQTGSFQFGDWSWVTDVFDTKEEAENFLRGCLGGEFHTDHKHLSDGNGRQDDEYFKVTNEDGDESEELEAFLVAGRGEYPEMTKNYVEEWFYDLGKEEITAVTTDQELAEIVAGWESASEVEISYSCRQYAYEVADELRDELIAQRQEELEDENEEEDA